MAMAQRLSGSRWKASARVSLSPRRVESKWRGRSWTSEGQAIDLEGVRQGDLFVVRIEVSTPVLSGVENVTVVDSPGRVRVENPRLSERECPAVDVRRFAIGLRRHSRRPAHVLHVAPRSFDVDLLLHGARDHEGTLCPSTCSRGGDVRPVGASVFGRWTTDCRVMVSCWYERWDSNRAWVLRGCCPMKSRWMKWGGAVASIVLLGAGGFLGAARWCPLPEGLNHHTPRLWSTDTAAGFAPIPLMTGRRTWRVPITRDALPIRWCAVIASRSPISSSLWHRPDRGRPCFV